MGNPIKFIGCLIKGHTVDPRESIMRDVMINPNNLLCKCHRCGFYVAYCRMSRIVMTLTEKGAYKLKDEFVSDMGSFILPPEETEKIRNLLYDMEEKEEDQNDNN